MLIGFPNIFNRPPSTFKLRLFYLFPQRNGKKKKKLMMRKASSYLTAAENIVGRGLDVEVPEDPDGLIFSLL